jgi:mannose/fructose/N-acetylgalactosamine-specific phosphotransferase system component IIC
VRRNRDASWGTIKRYRSGLVGGFAAVFFVKLPLILLGIVAMAAALLLKSDVTQHTDDRTSP